MHIPLPALNYTINKYVYIGLLPVQNCEFQIRLSIDQN